ncbi:hypothetical protein SESBI_50396 [Sesbania bispinosa]|nr:hypothetical protein SESBI_50396 [Sesbania bispinosa]
MSPTGKNSTQKGPPVNSHLPATTVSCSPAAVVPLTAATKPSSPSSRTTASQPFTV